MQLVQSRIVTDDVEAMASFYADLVGALSALNEYYVEVQSGAVGRLLQVPLHRGARSPDGVYRQPRGQERGDDPRLPGR